MTAGLVVTEEQFTEQVLDAARAFKWMSAHFRPALTGRGWRTPVQGDGAGFPDLVLARGPRMIAAELKVPKTKMLREAWADEPGWLDRVKLHQDLKCEARLFQPGQIEWLQAAHAAHLEVYLWTPADLDAVIGALK